MNRNKFVGTLVGAIFMFAGILVAVICGIVFSKTIDAQKKCTATTVGTLVRYEEEMVTVSKRSTSGKTRHTKKLHYEPVFDFEVGGKTYSIQESSMGKEDKPYEIGSTIEIHYEPADPSNNYIIEITPIVKYLTVGFGSLFAIVGFIVMIASIKGNARVR